MMQPALAADIFAQPLPDFFPESLRRACAGKQIHYTLPRAVRERMQVPEDLTGSQWAEKYRRVTEIDAQPGRWRQDLVPHTKKPMDTISLPWVKEAWLCMVERSAKTQILLNACMRQIDRGIDSGNVFWLMPSQHDANKALGERIVPALKASPRTSRLLSRYADDTTRSLIRFKHGPRLIPAWSNSPGSISSFYGKLNIGDEVDKYSSLSGGETDPITLLKKRGRDSDESKFLFASTPASKFIYKGMLACQQIWTFKNRCPHCDEFVLMDAEHFVIPSAATVESVNHGQDPVTYACNACGVEWDEADRSDSYQLGDWAAIKGADVERPVSVGFHMPAFPLPNIKMAEIGAAIVRARSGDLAAKMDLAHGYKAIDYEQETAAAREEGHLLRYTSGLPRNAVPLGTAMLGLLTDTQQDSFYYQIWAFGYAPEIDMRMIRHGQVQVFTDLEYLLQQEVFLDADGREFKIQLGLIDSGGTRNGWQKHSRTVEVYDWCSKNRLMVPIKGIWSRRDGGMISYKTVETLPGTNKRIPGGLVRADLKVDYFKDELSRRLAVEPDDPGAILYHDDIDAAFATHFCTETKNEETGEWHHDKKKGRNDHWDCNVYAVALREILKTRIPRRPGTKEPTIKKPAKKNFAKGW
jgi:phage terminase large subunit GpA-like protein